MRSKYFPFPGLCFHVEKFEANEFANKLCLCTCVGIRMLLNTNLLDFHRMGRAMKLVRSLTSSHNRDFDNSFVPITFVFGVWALFDTDFFRISYSSSMIRDQRIIFPSEITQKASNKYYLLLLFNVHRIHFQTGIKHFHWNL